MNNKANTSNFIIGTSLWSNGATYKEKNHLESDIFLMRHETVEEIIATTIHEDIHRTLWYKHLSATREHRAIMIIMWAENYF